MFLVRNLVNLVFMAPIHHLERLKIALHTEWLEPRMGRSRL